MSLGPGDLATAADELRALKARLLSLGAIDPEAFLEVRTRRVNVRFNVEANEIRIRTLIDALLAELALPRTWSGSGVADYAGRDETKPSRPR